MNALIWTLLGFLLGSLPFSVWLGKLVLRDDIRRYGDGNPGGTNVVRAGNTGLGLLVIFLDMLKGATPVALAHYVFKVDGWPLVPVILAPMLGHAFSPFLRLRGGKALASIFGTWTALTVPFGPFVMGLSVLALYKTQTVSGWAALGAWICMLAFLLVTGASFPRLAAWAGTAALIVWKHREDLRRRPEIKIGRRST